VHWCAAHPAGDALHRNLSVRPFPGAAVRSTTRLRHGLSRRYHVSGPGPLVKGHCRMLATRAMASPMVISAMDDWTPISSLAFRVMGIVSVGLKAVALVRLRYK